MEAIQASAAEGRAISLDRAERNANQSQHHTLPCRPCHGASPLPSRSPCSSPAPLLPQRIPEESDFNRESMWRKEEEREGEAEEEGVSGGLRSDEPGAGGGGARLSTSGRQVSLR